MRKNNMKNLSVIIPNRNSPFLTKTVEDILSKSVTDVEVIINVDEKWPEALLGDERVTYVHPGTPRGMRAGINTGLALAKGKYIMKCDDHCMFAPGFDKVLSDDCADDWVVIPRRYSLDAENWKIDESRPIRDYHYLCYPRKYKEHDWGIHGVDWFDRGKERSDPKYDIDNTMSFQGSAWFANREHFMKIVGFLDDRRETYSTFAQEPQEIGLKYWLKGGRNVVNKKTWYAHLHKGRRYGRMYKQDIHTVDSHNWSADHWMGNKEPGIKYDIAWLVEKFWPVPTWPEDRSLWISPFDQKGKDGVQNK
jgi:glycosyltransferase involved in cell wall biosynthesis